MGGPILSPGYTQDYSSAEMVTSVSNGARSATEAHVKPQWPQWVTSELRLLLSQCRAQEALKLRKGHWIQ